MKEAAMTNAPWKGRLISADPRPKTFSWKVLRSLLAQENLDDVITLFPRQTFLIQSLEQSLGSQIRFLFRQHFGIAQFFVEDIFLRARRKVGSGRHRNRARKHRSEARDNHNRSVFGRISSPRVLIKPS